MSTSHSIAASHTSVDALPAGHTSGSNAREKITCGSGGICKWFNILNIKNNQVNGYVIMPNHLHALVYVDESSTSINKLVANGKIFMAYEIVKRLKQLNKTDLLVQ